MGGRDAPEITIRAATLRDLGDIRRLLDLLRRTEYEEGYDPTIDLAWIFSAEATRRLAQSISGPNGLALVATSDGQVVGCLLGGLRPGEHVPTGEVQAVYVLPGQRRKGFGSGLMAPFAAWCEQQDLRRVTLAVAPANSSAIAFYERMGFREILRIPGSSAEAAPPGQRAQVPTLVMEKRVGRASSPDGRVT
jgi:ribosomal protein S18 acetylase RimI-like enzyme